MKWNGLLAAMIEFDAGDPRRIQHFLKVHGFARLIGLAEGLDAQTQYRLELAAAVHDIGIRPAERSTAAATESCRSGRARSRRKSC